MRIFLALILWMFSFVGALAQKCKDEDGNPVDWFVVAKLPSLKQDNRTLLEQGKGYMFIIPSTLEKGWQLSKNEIDGSQTLLSRTLDILDDNEVLWLTYNDQAEKECETCGHTKGIVAGDQAGGFWMVHSIPHLIDKHYPESALRNGELLLYNQPNIQNWNAPRDLQEIYHTLMKTINKSATPEPPYFYNKTLESMEGIQFTAFAKSREFNRDLYEWVAETLEDDLYAETWINEKGVLPSSCNLKYRVMNVYSMEVTKLNLCYSTHKDHSKLAISRNKSWVCIGDINRALSQEHRGGGTVCLRNATLWNNYFNMISTADNCKGFYSVI